jgi:hypothetical protein
MLVESDSYFTVMYKSGTAKHIFIVLELLFQGEYMDIPFQWCTQEFFLGGGSTNSVEDRWQRDGDLGALAP